MSSLRLSPETVWKPVFKTDLLDGVSVLEGTLTARSFDSWEGKLYREFKPAPSTTVATKLIPYFAWSNRGPSEMTVWIPID